MIPKDCKRLAEVDFPMPRSTSTRRERSAVEVWGRGTNRVIEMCEQQGAPPPVFEEKQGFLVAAFRAPLVAGGAAGTSRSESGDQVTAQVTAEVTAQVAALRREPQPAKTIMAELGFKHWKTFQANYSCALDGHGHSGTDHLRQAAKPDAEEQNDGGGTGDGDRPCFRATSRLRTARDRFGPQGPVWHKEGQGPAMIPKACKHLAEVDFSIADVSRHAAREKSTRHGHPSTLHLLWSRRPLASSRAASLLCAEERRMAKDRHDCFCRYVVTDCDSTPRLQERIRDPARLEWNEVTKVAHYDLAVNAMTKPIQVREDSPPYGGKS